MGLRQLWEWLIEGPLWIVLAAFPTVGYLLLFTELDRAYRHGTKRNKDKALQ